MACLGEEVLVLATDSVVPNPSDQTTSLTGILQPYTVPEWTL